MPGIVKRFRAFQGPAAFTFVDPDTGFKFDEPTREKLFNRVVEYRVQNRLEPIKALETVLENYWCNLPENIGKCEVVNLKRGWYHYVSGGVALLENLFFGEANMVEQGVADWRGEICAQCPNNVFVDKEGFVKWADEIAEASTGGRISKYHDELGNCELCTCPLRAKVWNKSAGMTREESLKAPDYCWAKKKE